MAYSTGAMMKTAMLTRANGAERDADRVGDGRRDQASEHEMVDHPRHLVGQVGDARRVPHNASRATPMAINLPPYTTIAVGSSRYSPRGPR